ncbi:TPA: precorrin-3B C(17)-methyltransferase [Candidatus Poribacteria bacterium]|nr:precorrin-3B C(17)-methyltransferase [Candidatus Poribacteria bacterium]
MASKKGKLFIVGIGPGDISQLTVYAQEVIQSSELVIGYRTYIDLIEGLIENQLIMQTGMGGEVERCQLAIEAAKEGKRVAVISSGDAGVYGMAGLVYEILSTSRCVSRAPSAQNESPAFEIEVVPGVPALCAASALLGAPLMNDFASISLSDLLTPWDVIAKRIEAAAKGDFVIVLYNPRSSRRTEPIQRVYRILSRYRKPTTPVGIVKNAYRDDCHVIISDLNRMLSCDIDMRTIIIVGNSTTFIFENRMITPRGYTAKYDLYSE